MIHPLIVRDFDFTRDFRQILWGYTLWYNLMRSLAAGLTVTMAEWIFTSGAEINSQMLLIPLSWPLSYLLFFLPIGLLAAALRNIPFAGLFSAFLGFFAVGLGDPLVCLIGKIFPRSVPIQSPPIFSLILIYWVLDAPEFMVADERSASKS